MSQVTLPPESASDLLVGQARHASPIVGMSPVFRPNVPSTLPDELARVMEIHRSLLREMIQQTQRTGTERAVTICGPKNPIASNIQNGDANSVSVPPCGTGSLSVAIHTHPNTLANPLLSLRDIQASIEREFDYVMALGTQTSEVIAKPSREEEAELRDAGLSRGLDIVQQRTISQSETRTLRNIHQSLREQGPFLRFNTGFLDVRAKSTVGQSFPFSMGGDNDDGEMDIGLPEITLFPTDRSISLGDKVIDAIISAFVTVVLFRIVFGGSPQEVISGAVEQFTGMPPEELQEQIPP